MSKLWNNMIREQCSNNPLIDTLLSTNNIEAQRFAREQHCIISSKII